MADRSPLAGGGWNAEHGLDVAHYRGDAQRQVAETLAALLAAGEVAPRDWIGERLTVLWADFMASRPSDPDGLTVWLIERTRLLSDLPHDILAHAIDAAIKTSSHGFIPSIGEIRAIADPLVAERADQIAKLQAMEDALNDPVATVERESRWEERRRHAEMMEARNV